MISNKDFVPLHCHSMFSHFDGLASVDGLVLEARRMGFPALALTDHGTIMGWVKFLQQCRASKDKKGESIPYDTIKPILGVEMYLCRKMDIGQYEENKDTSVIKSNQPDGRRGNRHINLYAMNFNGYKNICKMSQRSYLKGFYFDPRIDIELLAKHSDGVMCGSACLSGVINVNLMYGRYDKAKQICGVFKEIFKENFFLEVMYHGIREEEKIIPLIFKLSQEMDVPVCATNDTHYIQREDGNTQEVLLCMSQQKCLKDPNRLRFKHKEFYLKSAEEMFKIFGNSPQCLYNTTIMAERIDTKDIESNLFGGMKLPKFDIPSEYNNSFDYLTKLAWDGLKSVGWDKSTEHIEALKKELNDVKVALDSNNYDFSTYFLIVRDYVQYAIEHGILTGPGRGSGYASLLLRCLGITYGVDPLKYGIWERFLGFKDQRFIKSSDFGFEDEKKYIESSDLDDDRDVENDLGGVDRY